MQHGSELTPAQQRIEALLGQLDPQVTGLDRDRLMFQAGQASCGSRRPWQVGCLVLTLLLGCSLIIRPQQAPSDSVFVQTKPLVMPVEVLTSKQQSSDYLKLQRQVMEEGLDVLPKSKGGWSQRRSRFEQERMMAKLLSS